MNAYRRFGLLPGLALLVAVLVSFAPGCSSSKDGPGGGAGGSGGEGGTGGVPPTPCTTNEECPSTDRCDVDLGFCVPKCTADNQCPRDTGTYCDLDSGVCIPGEPCEGDFTCGSDRKFGYCKETGDCVCVPDASIEAGPTSANGVCWRVAETCAPCNDSIECGNSANFGNKKADCKRFTLGAEETGVCLPQNKGACPPGMVPMDTNGHPGLEGYCMPQGGDCAKMTVCQSDNDCKEPNLPVCDPVRQICIPGCSFDFREGESVGCAPGRVCHATVAGTNPDLLNDCATAPMFGVGTCDASCTEDDQCAKYDPSFVCKADREGGPKRCRPEGCIDDSECADGQGVFYGYCDVRNNQCVYDGCRAGLDPRRGCGSTKLYEDCVVTHKCLEGDEIGLGTCVEKTCIDNGGANLGCLLGNFCAGEVYLDPIDGSPVGGKVVKTPQGAEAGECYPMDEAAWCNFGCEAHADCNSPQNPVKSAGNPSICADFGAGNTCAWGCEFEQDCPGGWSCNSQGLEFPCGGLQICKTDAECGAGNRCVDPQVNGGKAFFNDIEPFKVCECSATDSCGGGFTCGAGVGTIERNPTEPNFEKVQARYCGNSTDCGKGGSCEWFGLTARISETETVPLFQCAATPPSMAGTVTCPAGTRRGRAIGDMYSCVVSSVCKPQYENIEGTLVCRASTRD